MNDAPTPIHGRTRHPEELKQRLLAAIESKELSRPEAAEKFKVNLHTVDAWLRARRHGPREARRPGRKPSHGGAVTEVITLRQRVMELEHEIGVLKEVIIDQTLTIRHFKVSQS